MFEYIAYNHEHGKGLKWLAPWMQIVGRKFGAEVRNEILKIITRMVVNRKKVKTFILFCIAAQCSRELPKMMTYGYRR